MDEFKDLVYVNEEEIDGQAGWLWPKADLYGWRGIFANWRAEHRWAYLEHIRNFGVVVQAGGHCGLFPRLFAGLFQRVYTFEPDALNFHCLVHNCQRDNVFKMNAALGAECKMIALQKFKEPGNTGTHVINGQGFIPMLTVDCMNFDACDFLQVDVEGYEINVLKGAKKTIQKFKPVLSVERTNKEIEDFLNQFGYNRGRTVELDTIYYV